jgi:arylsulfatase A-like enzyme
MPSADPHRPNILFVFSDQQRWDTCGCYSADAASMNVTPNLDRMAAEGVRFANAFTCQPVCGPARACLQTGKWATETGCFKNNIALPLDERTLAHHLAEAGYEVGYIGKWHLASDPDHNFRTIAVPPERRGGYKDYWLASDVLEFTSHGYDGYLHDGQGRKVDFHGYRVDCVTDFALDFLRTRTGEQPFFLFLSYIEPHHQNDHNRYEGPNGSEERFENFIPPHDLAGIDKPGDWRENYPDYLGCIHSLDQNLGRLRDLLDGLGIADSTLVVYTSDHGSHFRTRNAEYKRSCHEASVHIPMVACGPRFRSGKVVEPLVSLIDLPATVLTAGGVEPPPTMRGRALQPLVDDPTIPWRDEVFIQISESQVGRAIRTRRWKYSVAAASDQPRSGSSRAASDHYVEECLYDLEADPFELNNLVRDAGLADVRSELRRTLQRRMAEADEEIPTIAPAS